ncbi:MAG: beta-galactosidase, partial [Clostridia bacterium]|nr:beta-galactosidase [Clostridia bacterium]
MNDIPRAEHPRPQWMRDTWQTLNGLWQFEIDNGRSGIARGYAEKDHALAGEITVPFCPQSKLSGVEYKDFILGAWYRRTVEITEEQLLGRVFLHFGAVDHDCVLFVNGREAGRHSGGYVSFSFEITSFLHPGENVLTLFVTDDERDPMIPRGKQSEEYHSHGCDYTRTTGIWQTVWLEFTPKAFLREARYYPDEKNGVLVIQGVAEGCEALTATAFYEGEEVGCAAAEGVQGA